MVSAKIPVKVGKIVPLTPTIKQFEFHPIDAPLLPFSAGSHIRLHLDAIEMTKAYSLISDPNNPEHYQIAVLHAEQSAGGSHHMHHGVQEGDIIEISPADNFFPLNEDPTAKHLFIAGGIGITPFLSYLYTVKSLGLPFELHYTFRDGQNAAFIDHLKTALKDQLFIYDNSQDQQLNVQTLIEQQPKHSHVYVCGPQSLINAVIDAGTSILGADHVHFENFTETGSTGDAFEVVFNRSGFSLMVDENTSILQAIEADKRINVECLCRNGVCGTCETAILEGEADHRDLYLDEDEQAEQKTMMICVSRAKGKRLVLDL
ncbi:PDR/VanB family oxidoreductase [Wohlfahrtiimonas chitiniclastica]|uniref:PDR/VanB family oxidoreductase n=1 Tax=Wohlfahrtiimonas chitiniclastica TaxID=400946 RepID=UPI0003789C14|nr:PDR/VanB family oxidoreductase [Wohlfahrtiimonas chitiniclastica]